jgi:Transposase domain (DUF772)
MRLFRHLQHWLSGSGLRLQVANVVPNTNAIRQWTDTLPWTKLVDAIEQSVARRFPKRAHGGRPPIPTRGLLALELLKHEGGASDEAICERLRTDVAVMYACGLEAVQRDRPQEPFGLPETLAPFRSRLDEALREELVAIQAAAAMDEGLVSPAPPPHRYLSVGTRQPTGHRGHHAVQGPKKVLPLIEPILQQCTTRAPTLTTQTRALQQDLQKAMRCFGRQGRGQGQVFGKRVRHTAQQL